MKFSRSASTIKTELLQYCLRADVYVFDQQSSENLEYKCWIYVWLFFHNAQCYQSSFAAHKKT